MNAHQHLAHELERKIKLPWQEILSYWRSASVRALFASGDAIRGPYWYHGTCEVAAQGIQSSGFRRGVNDAVYFGCPLTASDYGAHLFEVELSGDAPPLAYGPNGLEVAIHDLSMIHIRRCIKTGDYWRGKLRELALADGVSMMPNADTFTALVEAVEARALWRDSQLHGTQHWRAVALAGQEIIAAGCPADPLVVLLFALLHDSQRLNDGMDPEHGPRAAALARELCNELCAPARLELLCAACEGHDRGTTTADPTIGACWDADRLNLWRVGIEPNPRYLSTEAGRTLRAWALDVHRNAPDWEVLRAVYSTL